MTSRSMTPAKPSSREADASRSRPKRRRPCSPASRSRACCAGWARRRYGNCDTTLWMAGARSSDADGFHGQCSGRQHGGAMDGALPLKSHWRRIKRYDQCAPLRPMPLRLKPQPRLALPVAPSRQGSVFGRLTFVVQVRPAYPRSALRDPEFPAGPLAPPRSISSTRSRPPAHALRPRASPAPVSQTVPARPAIEKAPREAGQSGPSMHRSSRGVIES